MRTVKMYFHTTVLILLGAAFVACRNRGCYKRNTGCSYETILDVKGKINDLCERLNATEEQLAGLQEYVDSLLDTVYDKIEEAIEEAAEGYVQKYDLDQDNWTLVFLGVAGNGFNVYNAWTNGDDVTTVVPTDLKRSLNMHYRDSNAVTEWDNDPTTINEVKFSLFDEELEVAYIIFDASGADRTSWFEKTRVLNSSWPSLLDFSPSYNYYSIAGHAEAQRRMFINREYGGCQNDFGYVTVKDLGPTSVPLCIWDGQVTFPQFLCSDQNGPTRWNHQTYIEADYMGIFVRYNSPNEIHVMSDLFGRRRKHPAVERSIAECLRRRPNRFGYITNVYNVSRTIPPSR